MPRVARRKKAKRGKRKVSRRGGASGLKSVISGLTGHRRELAAQRDALDAEISAIDSALSAIGGTPAASKRVGRPKFSGAGRGRRGPRKGSLKEYIGKVLKRHGRVMAVKDITSGVLKAGYKSKNKTLAKSVGIALTEMHNVAKVGRGRFRMK